MKKKMTLNQKLDAQHKKLMAKFKKMRARGAERADKQNKLIITGGNDIMTGKLDDWDYEILNSINNGR